MQPETNLPSRTPNTGPIPRFLRLALIALALTETLTPRIAAADDLQAVSLAGDWRLRLDGDDAGIRAEWASQPLENSQPIRLPSTTDLAGYGSALDTDSMRHADPFPLTTRFPGVKEPARADEHGYLVRRHLFVGPAWYEREIRIPDRWADRYVTLELERTLWKTDVWLDGRKAGSSDSLVAPHVFDLGQITPGTHRLTVRVDNRLVHNLSTITHAYGPETQTRWNGLVGKIELRSQPWLAFGSTDPGDAIRRRSGIQVFPAADRLSVKAVVPVRNRSQTAAQAMVRLRIKGSRGEGTLASVERKIDCPPGHSAAELTVRLTKPGQAWDEFNPARYSLETTLLNGKQVLDQREIAFGFRHIERSGRELRLNGQPLFLRGTLDCCVYPNTGHPPMTVPEWRRVLKVVKRYGFNHVRFHTWCPPEAAFTAADELGIYLQPETPAWVDDWGLGTVTRPSGIGRDPQVFGYLQRELQRLLAAYGNHPSFLMLTIGNEFGDQATDWESVNEVIQGLKQQDPRRLYSGCTARRLGSADDYWITHNSGASTRGVGPAHTDWDFAKAVEAAAVPVISHETGQRPVFPDYARLLPKFKGPLLPLNLERYRSSLERNGLKNQLDEFVSASARFQIVQYKAEHEAMLRTSGLAGYQLLMLNDFTGQSEAHVGVLDPFWEPKSHVTEREVLPWNGPTVVLARLPKFSWTAAEVLKARFEIAHHGPNPVLEENLVWTLSTAQGRTVAKGNAGRFQIPRGTVGSAGSMQFDLANVATPARLTLKARFGDVGNEWNLWVFDPGEAEPAPADVLLTRRLDAPAQERLRAGGKVLLLAHGLKGSHGASTGFESVYWSAGWWGNQFSSLGIVCDPRHPALAAFPTESSCDWQWRELRAGATTFDLQGAPAGFRPIVQPVPDFHFNHLLAQVFEARVGSGRLLVCGYDLEKNLPERPAARQLRKSLFRYAAGPAFQPKASLPLDWVEARFRTGGLAGKGAAILKVDSEDTANGNVALNAIDGDPATFWHTRWQPAADGMPHQITLDLGRPFTIRGVVYHPRRDQANGRVAKADIFCWETGTLPSTPTASAQFDNSAEPRQVRFQKPVVARYLAFFVKAEVNGQPFASLAELELIE